MEDIIEIKSSEDSYILLQSLNYEMQSNQSYLSEVCYGSHKNKYPCKPDIFEATYEVVND